ncbi:MAG: cysteine hydrolase [Deltaproteobacteria bacterium HGW-Deltaproteobacteria-21]|nr:MAG: cysteine hydrolase [Deltaproteobacteria bacterium HGW-Deltaproteobacteria-21]
MVQFKIYPEKSCLLIIDMINAFLTPGSRLEVAGGRELIPGLTRLLDACRKKNICVIFVKMAYRPDRTDVGIHGLIRPEIMEKDILIQGTEDVEFHKGIEPEKDDIILTKKRFSAFVGTELDLILRARGIDTIIIGGVATNVCCESTARDARMKDYRVIFLSDGNAPMSFPDMGWGRLTAEDIQRVVLTTMSFLFAQVSSIDSVVAEICES